MKRRRNAEEAVRISFFWTARGREGGQYRYIGGRRRGGGRIKRIAARKKAAEEELKEFLDFSWALDRGEAL